MNFICSAFYGTVGLYRISYQRAMCFYSLSVCGRSFILWPYLMTLILLSILNIFFVVNLHFHFYSFDNSFITLAQCFRSSFSLPFSFIQQAFKNTRISNGAWITQIMCVGLWIDLFMIWFLHFKEKLRSKHGALECAVASGE